ncbi:hypothetical protein ALP83_200097 [Pseudomonas syringae pv. actinidiae]|uniref:Uncharacterized protein n=1 Tax=Pseudomonas syringae pv. actinidiae TaxID=103796 RepID=A0A7Z6UFZ7_PSESF|nr:hypothetical protein ALP83_200097 [Pseudomonas syringae pv. actinidiae]
MHIHRYLFPCKLLTALRSICLTCTFLHQPIIHNRFYLSSLSYNSPTIAKQSISTTTPNKTVYISTTQITCTIYKPYEPYESSIETIR